ncbi:MAG: hypothetical protein HQL56_15095 [Magnetococcales bacterium]|nr:hypothetical protein [Magnetococcales bacterium]
MFQILKGDENRPSGFFDFQYVVFKVSKKGNVLSFDFSVDVFFQSSFCPLGASYRAGVPERQVTVGRVVTLLLKSFFPH